MGFLTFVNGMFGLLNNTRRVFLEKTTYQFYRQEIDEISDYRIVEDIYNEVRAGYADCYEKLIELAKTKNFKKLEKIILESTNKEKIIEITSTLNRNGNYGPEFLGQFLGAYVFIAEELIISKNMEIEDLKTIYSNLKEFNKVLDSRGVIEIKNYIQDITQNTYKIKDKQKTLLENLIRSN